MTTMMLDLPFKSPLWIFLLVGMTCADLFPFFITEPTSVVIEDGLNTSVTLMCDVGPLSYPAVNVKWTFNDDNVLPTDGIVINGSKLHILPYFHVYSSTSSYSIRHSVPHSAYNGGVYRCIARNSVGAVISRPAKVNVLPQNVKPSEERLMTSEGNVVVLPCRILMMMTKRKQSSTSKVEFQFNGKPLEISSRHRILPSNNLQIEEVNQSDIGAYRCFFVDFSSHLVQTSSTIVHLDITTSLKEVPSTFIWTSPRNVQVIEGQILSLECVADGRPIPLITWLRYGGVLPIERHHQYSGVLVINEVRKMDEGTYICRAENTAGPPEIHVVFVDILQPPNIIHPPIDQTIKEGNRVTFSCRSRGSSKLIVSWFHNALPLFPSSVSVKMNDRALTLMNVQRNQSGVYQCIVANAVDSSSASARLTIEPRVAASRDRSYLSAALPQSQVSAAPLSSKHFQDVASAGVSSPKQSRKLKEKKTLTSKEENSTTIQSYREKQQKKKKTKGPRTYDRFPNKQMTVKNLAVMLVPPSEPIVVVLSDTSVVLKWMIDRSDGLNVTFFKVQFKETKNQKNRKFNEWQTIDEDISPNANEFIMSNLRSGSTYQFRLVAIYSNNDNKHGPNSKRIFMSVSGLTSKMPVTIPVIVAVNPLSGSEILLDWQFLPSKREIVDGFMIHYKLYDDIGYIQHMVHGSNVRQTKLSGLEQDTLYSLRMQSFNAEGFSDFSNTVVKKTNGLSDNVADVYNVNSYTPLILPHFVDQHSIVDENDYTDDDDDVPHSLGTTSQATTDFRGGILTRTSYSQQNSDLMFVVLGVVLGAIFIIILFIILFCFWRQRQQQLLLAALQVGGKNINAQSPLPSDTMTTDEREHLQEIVKDDKQKRKHNKNSRIPSYICGGCQDNGLSSVQSCNRNGCCHQSQQQLTKCLNQPLMMSSSQMHVIDRNFLQPLIECSCPFPLMPSSAAHINCANKSQSDMSSASVRLDAVQRCNDIHNSHSAVNDSCASGQQPLHCCHPSSRQDIQMNSEHCCDQFSFHRHTLTSPATIFQRSLSCDETFVNSIEQSGRSCAASSDSTCSLSVSSKDGVFRQQQQQHQQHNPDSNDSGIYDECVSNGSENKNNSPKNCTVEIQREDVA